MDVTSRGRRCIIVRFKCIWTRKDSLIMLSINQSIKHLFQTQGPDQGCPIYFHREPHQHHGRLLKGRLHLKLCIKYSQHIVKSLFACDYCLFECRNIIHKNIYLILSHESNSFETFKYRIGNFSEISSKKRCLSSRQGPHQMTCWAGFGPRALCLTPVAQIVQNIKKNKIHKYNK